MPLHFKGLRCWLPQKPAFQQCGFYASLIEFNPQQLKALIKGMSSYAMYLAFCV